MSHAPHHPNPNDSRNDMQRTDDSLARFLVGRLEQTGAKVTQPSLSLMSPRFQWVPSYSTDLRESFRRIKEAQEATQ
jgi:hypothetical protein